jgi:hypothetical protein
MKIPRLNKYPKTDTIANTVESVVRTIVHFSGPSIGCPSVSDAINAMALKMSKPTQAGNRTGLDSGYRYPPACSCTSYSSGADGAAMVND